MGVMSIPYSVLDLSPIIEGGDAGQSLHFSAKLARHAEALGYTRFWMAEHHNMPGIASAATAVALAHVGAHTKSIRIGAGGVMLPNHAPYVVAEQFGTLAALHPGRVDLGLGRAPGGDMAAARALRRNLQGDADGFPQDVAEIAAYFRPAQEGQRIVAVPGEGLSVPIWILGSSLYGAQLAAAFGLPYAFASHFAPELMMQAIELYRRQFKPSEQLEKPYVMLGCNVFAGDTDAEGTYLATSMQQAFVNLRSGRPAKLQPPREGYLQTLDPQWRGLLDNILSCSFIGSPATVRAGLQGFIERTGADEVIVASQIFDPAKRLRSYEIAAQAMG